MKVLFFAPNPDDDVIACGGTLALHVRRGDHVSVIYMTSGNAGNRSVPKEELAIVRQAEAAAAASAIGIQEIRFMANDDGYLEVDRANFVFLIDLIREVRPDRAYVPHEEEGHRDHRMAAMLANESLDRAAGPWFQETQGEPWRVAEVYAYEVLTPMAAPSHYVDITGALPAKIAAIEAHESQLKDIDYLEMIKGLNRYRGVRSGAGTYVEAFRILRGDQML